MKADRKVIDKNVTRLQEALNTGDDLGATAAAAQITAITIVSVITSASFTAGKLLLKGLDAVFQSL